VMRLATWNVNGIRARQAQVQEWIERERPDVVCLQEIKATTDQVPAALCEMEGYWCYWHGGKGYSGVALHVSKAFAPERPTFTHPSFDYETRIATVEVATAAGDLTVASVYVPNGGKDFRAKMQFLEAMDAYAASFQAAGRQLALMGDMNVARTERDVHPKERKPRAIGQLPEERAIPTTTNCSPGGRRGATCGSGTSAGGSITCSRARRWPRGRRPAPCRKISARATTRR